MHNSTPQANKLHQNRLRLAESLAQVIENPACPFKIQLEIIEWFNSLDPENVLDYPTLPAEDAKRIRERLPYLGIAMDQEELRIEYDDDRPFDGILELDVA